MGREPLEIFRLAAGLWYTERRDLITALYTLLRVTLFLSALNRFSTFGGFLLFFFTLLLQAVVLDQGLEDDLVSDIQKYLEDLIKGGLRQRLISLMKV